MAIDGGGRGRWQRPGVVAEASNRQRGEGVMVTANKTSKYRWQGKGAMAEARGSGGGQQPTMRGGSDGDGQQLVTSRGEKGWQWWPAGYWWRREGWR
ncbi:hypothetical protein BT93_L2769 [Corymbia citriodora subsp. variegata]|uniref:Uncharacterized protein n=1 Tax=Corymbia citriodora subsp. variegata TaxID=360336 RepID=A0A8T0CK67_CORYI|nr:hypothetical protein BT93_L2769 [Corymbia citriodora subsp. variegata]